MSKLTLEQQEIVERFGEGQVIIAGAGCGKTTTLVAKCIRLIERFPEAKFTAISFTERSSRDLKKKLSEKIDLSRHWVSTIHGFCSRICRDFPEQAGLQGDERLLDEMECEAFFEEAFDTLFKTSLPKAVESAFVQLSERQSISTIKALILQIAQILRNDSFSHLVENAHSESLKSLLILSEFVLKVFKENKRNESVIDFDDLESQALQALRDPQVHRFYRREFDLVLVDEFQDTNFIQAEILKYFSKPSFTNLCVVGDPKQSIYRFRNAELEVFFEFCEKLPLKHKLTANFRSRPGIIEFTNSVCKPLFEASHLEYVPLEPHRTPDLTGESPVVVLELKTEEDLARFIKAEQERGIKLSEMVLLLKKIRGAEKWLKALSREGISLALGSGGFFWEDPKVRELVCFLDFFFSIDYRFSAAVFLSSPWSGVSFIEKDAWLASGDRDLREMFFSSQNRIAIHLKDIRRESAPNVSKVLLGLLEVENLEEVLGIQILSLWHLAEDYLMKGMSAFEIVGRFKKDKNEKTRRAEIPAPKSDDQIPVLTLHSSKGLEFKHVILVDFGKKERAPSAPLLFWNRKKGIYLGERDADGERIKELPVEQEWRKFELDSVLSEKKRLFYVALTRAEERLILALPLIENEKLKETDDVYLIDRWRSWVEKSFDSCKVKRVSEFLKSSRPLVTETKTERVSTLSKPFEKPKLKRSRHSVTEWLKVKSCPKAYSFSIHEPYLQKTEWASDTFSQRGSAIHEALSREDTERLEHLVGARHPLLEWVKENPVDSQTRVETAFEVPIQNEILVGAIDRIFETDDEIKITDYKITEKITSREEMISRYSLQLELYTWAYLRMKGEDGASKKISAVLLQAVVGGPSSKEVISIEVPVSHWVREKEPALILEILRLTQNVIDKKEAKPLVSAACRYCSYLQNCTDGSKWLGNGNSHAWQT